MKDIAIFGAGGLGKEVACLVNRINVQAPTWRLIGFFDDNPDLKGTMVSHFGPCLGTSEDLNRYPQELAVVIAIGNPQVVKQVVGKIQNPLISFPNLIHPSFVVTDPETFQIGQGNIIQANCTVTVDVKVGDFNILNGSVCLAHDTHVGSYNMMMPGVRISGGVTIGDENFFGVYAVVLQQLAIGHRIRLGAGSILMTKPKDGHLYVGNPAIKTEL